MKISAKNLFARYYNWIYGELPNDVCSFFWGSVLAIGLFPILALGRIWMDNSFGNILGLGLFHYIGYGILLITGVDPYGEIFMGIKNVEYFHQVFDMNPSNLEIFLYMPLTGLLILLCIGLTAGSIILGIYGLFSFTLGTVSVTISGAELIRNTKDVVGAIRRKHCTKIIWK
jgi:hypothetical protein